MTDEMAARLFIIIGENIKKYRKKLSQTQEDLAEKTGLSRASIANIETARQHLTIETLWDIAKALETDPHVLLPSTEEVKIKYDNYYFKQSQLSESGKNWIKGVIEQGGLKDEEKT
ncbi:MAG TPA: helix-turn-helix transcriptional regulator [Methylomirabilota bacterium]|nr:helix-turn-helix transcriptional regulator [Methylomirabilota bacterium]